MAIGRPISLTPNIATKNISSLATADQTEFTVTGGYRINEIAVYRNGVRLAEGRDFTASDGDTVNLVTAATVDDVIEFAVFDSFNVSDAIVSAASSQNLNGDFNVTGSLYAGTFEPSQFVAGIVTSSTAFYVGSALTANAAGDVETIGIITASSFYGDGSSLTGVGETVNVRTNTITVSGVSTFTGVSNFSAAVNVDATTDSTSSTTGALIVDGGLGVAKNVYIGAGLSVAGTLTYEDVTQVDSVGLITAQSGVNVSGGQLQVGVAYSVGSAGVATALGFVAGTSGFTGSVTGTTGSFSSNLTVGSGITFGSAGVATFSGTSDVHLVDTVQLKMGDSSDFQLYHNGVDNYIIGTTGDTVIRAADEVKLQAYSGSEDMLVADANSSVKIYYDGSEKFRTTNDGTVTTGIGTFTTNVAIDAAFGEAADDANDLVIGSTSDTQKGISIVGSTSGGVGNIFFTDGAGYKNQGYIQYRHADDEMRIRAGGTDILRLTSTKVGVGTTNPQQALHVEATSGDSYVQVDTNGNGGILLDVQGTQRGVFATDSAFSGNLINLAIGAKNDLRIRTGGSYTQRLIIGEAGISTFSATPHDDKGSLRDIPLRSVTGSAATLVAADAGKVVSTNTTGWTVPGSTFDEGDTVTLLNNSAGGLVITCSAVTTYLTSDGTTVTSKTLGARGLATLYFVSSSVAYLQGTALS